MDVGPEGGAAFLALERLLEAGTIGRGETVVVFNTGGDKYR